ncbi:unnamed protein product [Arctogadus glacialis]
MCGMNITRLMGLHETLALLTSQLHPDANPDQDLLFLQDVFSERSIAYLMKIHGKLKLYEKQSPVPVLHNASCLVEDLADELHCGPMESDERELLYLLNTPHLKAVLAAHDTVAQKSFDPVLPPLPEDLEEELEEESVKIVRLVKNKEPLGATIRRDEVTGAVIVARIMRGGAADRSGLVHVGDELREVNGNLIIHKRPDEISQILSQSQGSITLKIIPATAEEDKLKESRVYLRALFDYTPFEDKATPCQEAGLPFRRGDVLQVVSQDDAIWWQAKKVGDPSLRAALVPSAQFQERRLRDNLGDRVSQVVSLHGNHLAPPTVTFARRHPSSTFYWLCTFKQVFRKRLILIFNPLIRGRVAGGSGRGGSSSSRGPQTSLSRATLTSSDRGIPRRSQASVEILSLRLVLGLPHLSCLEHLPRETPKDCDSDRGQDIAGLRRSFRLKRDRQGGTPVDPRSPDAHTDFLIYEEVTRYQPRRGERARLIVLIGSLGARINELKQKVIAENPRHYGLAVPHTTRARKSQEREGVEYHFITKAAFELDVQNNKFIEFGEYKDNLYGTSLESIRSVLDRSKVCLVDVHAEALKSLRTAEFRPYVVFVRPRVPSSHCRRLGSTSSLSTTITCPPMSRPVVSVPPCLAPWSVSLMSHPVVGVRHVSPPVPPISHPVSLSPMSHPMVSVHPCLAPWSVSPHVSPRGQCPSCLTPWSVSAMSHPLVSVHHVSPRVSVPHVSPHVPPISHPVSLSPMSHPMVSVPSCLTPWSVSPHVSPRGQCPP